MEETERETEKVTERDARQVNLSLALSRRRELHKLKGCKTDTIRPSCCWTSK